VTDSELLDEIGLGHLSLIEAQALVKIAVQRKKVGEKPPKNISILPKTATAECIKCNVELWVDFIWLDGRPKEWQRAVIYHVKNELGACKQIAVRNVSIVE